MTAMLMSFKKLEIKKSSFTSTDMTCVAGRDIQGERDRERQTDRQTGRQTDTETERDKKREEKDRERERAT